MAVIKVACPKCGQKVSGDESFYGRSVNCPICTAKIVFPDDPNAPVNEPHALPNAYEPVPPAGSPEPAPGAATSHEPVPPAGAYPDPPPRPGPEFEERPVSSDSAIVESTPPSEPDSDPLDEVDRDDGGEVPSPLLGTISLVVGILNTVTLCIPSLILAPTAIIVGHIALTKAKHSPVKPAPGQSLAMIGVILGYAGIGFAIFLLIAIIIFKEPLSGFLPAPSSES